MGAALFPHATKVSIQVIYKNQERIFFIIILPPQLPSCWTKPSIPHHPAKRQQNKKNHRLKSMVLVLGWRMVHPELHFSSSCAFPKCSCWSMPAPNPTRNEYGKLEVVCLVHYFNHLLNKPFSVFHIISFFIDDNFP